MQGIKPAWIQNMFEIKKTFYSNSDSSQMVQLEEAQPLSTYDPSPILEVKRATACSVFLWEPLVFSLLRISCSIGVLRTLMTGKLFV